MNERIKELAERAWAYQITVYEDNGVRTYGEQEKVFSKQKFAELIVRECLAMCQHDTDDDDDQFDLGRAHQAKQTAELIETHFGVEL